MDKPNYSERVSRVEQCLDEFEKSVINLIHDTRQKVRASGCPSAGTDVFEVARQGGEICEEFLRLAARIHLKKCTTENKIFQICSRENKEGHLGGGQNSTRASFQDAPSSE